MTIQEILAGIQKSAIATAAGGQLTTEQAKEFIDLVVAQSDFLKMIQTVQMTSSTYQLNTIDIASRVMRKAPEGTDPGFTQGVTISPRTLTQSESILPYDVTFSFLEENIEGGGAEQKINQMFAAAFGNELLDLGINGDDSLAETITDANDDDIDDVTGLSQNDHTFLRQNDGWIAIARADAAVHKVELVLDEEGNPTTSWKNEFKKILAALPNKWKRAPGELLFLVSPDVETKYRNELGERSTALGDVYLTQDKSSQYQGVPVKSIPFWPGGTIPKIMLTKPKNLAIGIGRNIRVGRQIQERKRIIEYTITAKTDFEYVVSDAIVLGERAS
jgi:hypothetical protein